MPSVTEIQNECFATAVEHGFWDGTIAPTVAGELVLFEDGKWAASIDIDPEQEVHVSNAVAAKLALIHSEVSEALEDLRKIGVKPTTFREDGKPEGFGSELADILIRVYDLSARLGYSMEEEVAVKMAYNKTRPYKHGKAI